MKIAIVHIPPGFGVSFLHATANVPRYLTQASAYRGSTRFFTEHVADPCPDLDLDMLPRGLGKRKRLALLKERIRLFAPDIIEVHSDRSVAFFLARRFRRTPVILTMHNSCVRQSLWNRFFRSLRFYAFARIICVGRHERDSYRRVYPEHAARFVAIPNAMPVEGSRGEAGSKEKILLWAGRSVPEKGLLDYAEAMATALPKLKDWRSVAAALVQTEKERRYFNEAQARIPSSSQERALWLSNLPHRELMAWMKKAAIFVMIARLPEGMALAALEAHVAGAAVISSGGPIKETSGHEGAVYLTEISGEAIAEAVMRLAKNDKERQSLALRGQDYVLKHHRIEDRAKELDALRRQILKAS